MTNKPNKVEEKVEEFHEMWKAEKFRLGDFYRGEAMPKIDSFLRQALTSSYEQGVKDERERIVVLMDYRDNYCQKDRDHNKRKLESLERMEKTKPTFCEHKFVYSHRETEQNFGTTSKILGEVDVVICEKCGIVLRYKAL